MNTAFIVEGLSAPFAANIRVVVQNTGTEADELVAVTTPLGQPTAFRTDGNLFSRQPPVELPIPLLAPTRGAESYLPLVGGCRGWRPGTIAPPGPASPCASPSAVRSPCP